LRFRVIRDIIIKRIIRGGDNLEDISLNVPLLRRRIPNLTSAARSVGLRPATVSDLCTGKIPISRAEVRTLFALATLAKCSMDELILRGDKTKMIETGIKVLDLFSPLTKGGTIGLVARPGMGQLVLLSEMLYRLKKDGYTAILLMPEGDPVELKNGLENVDVIILHTIEEVYEEILRMGKGSEIALAADRSNVITGEIYNLQERLLDAGITSFLTFLVDLKGESVDEELPYGPLETLWRFDAELAARDMFPAINPFYSTSSILEGEHLDQFHFSTQQRAKKLLRRYRELKTLVSIRGVNSLPASEVQTYNRGERLEAYLTQYFFVAEPYTGKEGKYVSIQDTLADVTKIVDGTLDYTEVSALQYIGKLL
jgi:F-type H+-transporting ATPase subunit beta